MRKAVILLLAVLVLAGCAAVRHSDESGMTFTVNELIGRRHFTIDVNYMYPQSGQPRYVNYDYSLTVHGDSLISFLPYAGRAYSVPYGGGKALNFSALITSFEVEKTRKGKTRILIGTRNEEDEYLYTVEVFDNGSADINVRSQHREQIKFRGNMDLTGK